MKKLLSMILALAMVVALASCGNTATTAAATTAAAKTEAAKTTAAETEATKADLSGKTINVAVGFIDDQLDQYKKLVAAFEDETGVKVELDVPGSEYEAKLKTYMAGNELPDVWFTHGWSLIRYSEYLTKLNDFEWADRFNDAALGVVCDADGNFYGACITTSVSGLMFNADVCAKAGVDPYSILTLDQLEDACAKIKAIGVTPIYIGGKESGNAAGFLGSLMPAMQTDAGCANDQAAKLIDRTYDWDVEGTKVMEKLADWVEKGWVNENSLTADSAMMQTALGEGTCAFLFRASTNLTFARKYVPNCNVGIIPIPNSGSGAPTYKIGESNCLGIWKDTKEPEAAAAFVEFMTRPEQSESISLIEGSVPSIIGAEVKDNFAIEQYVLSQSKIAKINYDNVFDRKYFPSGMWGTMGEAVQEVLANGKNGVAKAVTTLKDKYQSLAANE